MKDITLSFDIPVDSQRDLDYPNSEVSTEDFIHNGSDHSSSKDSPDDISVSPGDLVTPGNITLGWQRNGGVGAGLQNMGNTCFLNSTLQCLTYTCPMVNYLLSGRHDHTCRKSSCLMCTFRLHILKAFSCTDIPFKPKPFILQLKRISENFVFGHQEDAHEFLRCLLSTMEDDIQDHPGCYQFSNNSTSVIKEVFGGVLQSQVKCLACNGEKIRSEEMMDLILDVENASDMLDSLQQFVRADLLEGDNACFCERCNTRKPAAITSTIESPPNVLTVALRRFSSFTGKKISKDFPFPETFDMRPFMSQPHGPAIKYNLYAVVVHSGTSTSRGHYYSYVKRCHQNSNEASRLILIRCPIHRERNLVAAKASNGSWYKMNDSLVNKVELSEVLLQKAYLLFYSRSTGAAGGENKEPSESVDMQSGDANRSNKQAQNKARCKIDTEYLSRCLQDHHAGKSSALPVVPTHIPLCCGTAKASRLKRQREDDDDNDDGCVGTKRVCHTHDDVRSRPEPPPLRTTSQGEPRQGIMKKRKRSKCEDGEDDEGKPKRRQVEWT